MKTAKEIRQSFIDFFVSKNHTFVRSAPVVPNDDPTLMFTNAGMNQFKTIFLGENPKGLKRAANSQKCMRVSGKHNDLEEVGVDHYHHTLFEMLGNWSFGDYYKKEAISWAWRLLTEVWEIPKEKLYVTVYKNDDETENFWKTLTDIDTTHVSRHDEKDNFWEMGETGPCGPCSEVHIDLGAGICPHEHEKDHKCCVNGENCHRFLELWNLVFIQYERQKDGSLKELPAKHVDTGMGFERVVRVMQGLNSNYDSDLFSPVIKKLEELSGRKYTASDKTGIPFRVIADHVRALGFAITDGVFPSNEGRGYVLRRLLRRAYRYGRQLGFSAPFIYKLTPVFVEMMGEAYPEIRDRADFVASVIKSEEERFDATLETGMEKFNQAISSAKKAGKTKICGADVFALYDTYGFPVDLTNLLAQENGFSVDEAGFTKEMKAQKERARAARNANDEGFSPDGWTELIQNAKTEFAGYVSDLITDAKVCRYKIISENKALAVFEKTPYYAEMGGQVGDTGEIANGDLTAKITATTTWNGMSVSVIESVFSLNKDFFESGKIVLRLDNFRRNEISRAHSATHLLQAALTKVLGDHVSQAGSKVENGKLRFDFTHFQAIPKMQLCEIEDIVNDWILQNFQICTNEMNIDEAKASGAKALFGEKYADRVRVVKMGDVSAELCGGTHARNTGDIGSFTVLSEASVSAGVRRIEALVGKEAIIFYRRQAQILSQISNLLKCGQENIPEKVENLQQKIKTLETEIKSANLNTAKDSVERIVSSVKSGSKTSFAVCNLGVTSKEIFTAIHDGVSETIIVKGINNVVICLIAEAAGAVMIAASADKTANANGILCGDLVKRAAAKVGGGGGGSPMKAQSGGKNPAGIPDAIREIETLLK
ncbi:MAG: alanine--tRNA ligase [Chitinispirillales bacterium]|jgi:alanyl-tRNA synthetase|nr:alanine--tRNA ligase [Chitinispirillales bacterium]